LQPESQEAKMQLEFGRVKMGISPLASHGREKHRKESKEQLLAKVLLVVRNKRNLLISEISHQKFLSG